MLQKFQQTQLLLGSSPSLHGHNHKTTPTQCHPQLWPLGEACQRQSGHTQSDVNCQLSSVKERKGLTSAALSSLARTEAPASLQTLANVRSGASALVRSLPECGHAALWRPLKSLTPGFGHRQWDPQTFQNRTWNRTRSILNSGLVGQPCNKCEQPLPE